MKLKIPTEKQLAALREVHRFLYPELADPYEAFDRLNKLSFDAELPTLPIERGLMQYGKCLGQTSCHLVPPRIAIGTYRPNRDPQFHDDVLVHEMLHGWLAMNGQNPQHNFWPWCQEIERITPLLGLRPIKAGPVNPRKVDGISVRMSKAGFLTRKQIAGWPHSLRGGKRVTTRHCG
jgi:hypothetical protein